MTELHNMSVPPRTTLKINRASLAGERYRIDLAKAVAGAKPRVSIERIGRRLSKEGAASLVPLLDATSPSACTEDVETRVRRLCMSALAQLRLPDRLGFFVHETGPCGDAQVPVLAAIAILAARSGPLYIPGRFEPSLITTETVTLFFPPSSDGYD
jgi:hypothetical protein